MQKTWVSLQQVSIYPDIKLAEKIDFYAHAHLESYDLNI